MKKQNLVLAQLLAFSALNLGLIQDSYSQTVFSEGVAGETDKKGRNPVISVGTSVKDSVVTLLVNSYVKSSDTKTLPTKFEIFVNGNQVASAIRETESTTPLVFPIDPEVAKAPLNYSIHAQVLHPSRSFSSVYSGTVFNSNLTTAFNCSLTLVSTDAETEESTTTVYEAEEVETAQTADNSYSLEFTAKDDSEDEKEVTVSANISTVADADDTASLTVTDGDDSKTYILTGESTVEDSSLTAIDFTSEDESVKLECGS